jgi:ATP-binding cassette subfamily C protein CydC
MALSDNGSGLSGGERRRLGLARAYLRPAPWLVLDEPTEGLDAACEARVIAGLRRRLTVSGQGLILISHRPAPRDLCDEVLTVEGLDRQGRLTMARAQAVAEAA